MTIYMERISRGALHGKTAVYKKFAPHPASIEAPGVYFDGTALASLPFFMAR
jgi:hypothetical protein